MREEEAEAARGRSPEVGATPGWVWAVCGWAVACAALEAGGRGPARVPVAARGHSAEADDPLAQASPRELRRLPGVGPTRALAIADHRWEHGPPPDARALEAIRGIGPITAARVAAWLAARTTRERVTGATYPAPAASPSWDAPGAGPPDARATWGAPGASAADAGRPGAGGTEARGASGPLPPRAPRGPAP